MYDLIVFLPLLGSLIAGLFGRRIGHRNSEFVTTGLLGVSCFLAWIAFFRVGLGHADARVAVANWFTVGDLSVAWALRIDTLTAVMLIVVTTVSTIVHAYSFGYMHDDPHRSRFFSYLSLFTFAMLMLVTSDNLVQMFFGWEGVGLASYLLIGFWYTRPSANAAAIKAFVVNRVGDFGFSLGIFLVFALTKSVTFDSVFAAAPGLVGKSYHAFGMEADALTLACLLLFMGAMGKSAQFLLHTWLPDAMEGPTPVSALIHAATMVTAGVFMVARLSPLFELAPAAQSFVITIGAITCFFAATIGLVQNDIKRVIAYSTCSQLGYMFVALGCGGYAIGIFHLFTHAFFKALLFLGAGSVIHAVGGEQDMRKMGGLAKKIPITFWLMTIGTLALTGFPFTAGYYSKDAIIEAAYASPRAGAAFGWLMTTIAAGLTSFYSWRLVFMTFFGPSRAPAVGHEETNHNTHREPTDAHPAGKLHPEHEQAHVSADAHPAGAAAHTGHHHDDPATAAHDDHGHGHGGEPHESPPIMLYPLYVLAFGALFAGLLFHHLFIGAGRESFWGEALFYAPTNQIFEEMERDPWFVSALPSLMFVAGLGVAYYVYMLRPGTAERWAKGNRPLYLFLLNKWYFDELYDILFVRPAFWLGRLFWKGGDVGIIDRFGPDGVANVVMNTTDRVVRIQTGYVYHYAFAMMLGVAAFITWYLVGGRSLMFGFGILSGLLLLPLVGAVLIAALQGEDEATLNNAKWIALVTSTVVFVVSLFAWGRFDTTSAAFQMVESREWLGSGLGYKLGVDGASMPFVMLTTFLLPFCIASAWEAIHVRVKEFMICFLVLETALIGVFVSLDVVLFYLFFEGGLIPMFLIIGIWGGKRRIYASMKFFLYTLLGSLLMLLAIMKMYGVAGTTDIPTLLHTKFPVSMQYWLWLAFFASFAVKMPMWPVHTWLPDAHVEAPTAGSVVLAGVLLKLGGYGFLRFSLPMFPEASHYFAPLVFALSIIAIVYTSLVALVQEDMKKLIAYSSVAHMGFVTMGLFTMTPQGIQGAIFLMISHGLVSGALFLCVGVVYDRMHTREIAAYGGLVERMPKYAVVMLFFTMANIGLPGTSGFVGEFLTMLAAFQVNTWVALFATLGTILSAAYALYLYRRIIFGKLEKGSLKAILDLSPREIAILAPLLLLTLYYGFHPQPILDSSQAMVDNMIPTLTAAAPPAPVKAASAASTPSQNWS